MNILYKFASRSRPERFFKSLKSIGDNAVTSTYVVLCSLDEDDPTMNTLEIMDWFKKYPRIIPLYGYSSTKVHAINRDMGRVQKSEWDLLIVMSDDMVFIKPGFDQIIIDDMKAAFPDGDGVLHYHDGNSKGRELMTMSIMGRKFYERFGYIYHPDYISLWCDNEAMDVARSLNKYKYMGDQKVLFNHLHPFHGHVHMHDPQYTITESYYKADESTYRKRKAKGFPPPAPEQIKLSILIPTVVGREFSYQKLRKELQRQIDNHSYHNMVEIHGKCDNKEMSVGAKRDWLYETAQGLFSWMVDDDDMIHNEGIRYVIDAIDYNPKADCIGFKENCMINGKQESSIISLKYKEWADNFDGFDHVRTPFFKIPIRTDLCQGTGVADMRYGEDHDFAKRIYPMLGTETFINEEIYFYIHNSTEHNERYGIK